VSNLLTFGEFKASRATIVAGLCADSAAFNQLVNDATRRLMRRGAFYGTTQNIQVCVRNGCVTLPRYVGSILAVNVCGNPIASANNWFSFLRFDSRNHGSCGSDAALTTYGTAPTYDDVAGTDKKVRLYIDVQADIGKTLTLYGLDKNGQVIRTKNADGNWTDGTVLTAAIPFSSTTMDVQRIDRISKELSQGNFRLYEYSTVNDTLRDLAVYAPSETEPNYLRARVSPIRSGCGCLTQLKMIIKLAFIPVVSDSDLILIDNEDALKLMIQCIKAEEANNRSAAREFEADAIRELNLELRDQYPDDTIPVSVNGFGSALPSRSGIGSIV
jgi:hypothetical protein